MRLTVGRQHLREIADDGRSKADYAILTADHAFSWARLRLFGDVRRVKDDIEDDLLQWVQLPNSRGELFTAPRAARAQRGGEHDVVGF